MAAGRVACTRTASRSPAEVRALGLASKLCNDPCVRLPTLAAVLFCLALIGARSLGLHFHEEGHAHDSPDQVVHADDHGELLLDHAVSHSLEGDADVDVDWVGAAGQSMPKVALFLVFAAVTFMLVAQPVLRRRTFLAELRPPALGLRTGLPPPGRGPPAYS